MYLSLNARTVRMGLLLLILALGASAACFSRVPASAWFAISQWLSPGRSALGLADYQAALQAQPIEGLSGDVSALTYDPDRNTLFTVTNKTPELVELSLNGDVLRRIALIGFSDPEAVEYIAPGTYVISDERQQRLVQVEVSDATASVDIASGHQLALGLGLNGNKGFEGLAYDLSSKRLYVAKERDPVRIYEVSGFPLGSNGPVAISVSENRQRDRAMFVKDLSSLQFDPGSGHLLIVSDESRVVVELDPDGKPIASLSLVEGAAGLKRAVPQPEGVAMDTAGNLYMVSEPNLFYRFEPRPAQ
ncbi:SdiA-regulated domain-containing protein [Pseudomonas japonica]|uniref:SdiA-regulated domain-containing protein n=1 Tax=Pseudomonas japonica TaxID=256466 RepID=UPI0015E44A22|nr:SdiA-regulated domain-containing protein [Pseudomonas japonica]MBA1287758.1 SdiA-regulated domain-containing protein [Pseudomonas japonica]